MLESKYYVKFYRVQKILKQTFGENVKYRRYHSLLSYTKRNKIDIINNWFCIKIPVLFYYYFSFPDYFKKDRVKVFLLTAQKYKLDPIRYKKPPLKAENLKHFFFDFSCNNEYTKNKLNYFKTHTHTRHCKTNTLIDP